MKYIPIFLLCFISIYEATLLSRKILSYISLQPIKRQFQLWHRFYKKPYDLNSNYAFEKYKVFQQNVERINYSNKLNKGYQLGIGPFTDVSYEEFISLYGNVQHKEYFEDDRRYNIKIDQSLNTNSNENIKSWNYLWPEGAKNQGECNACWAFTTISLLEAKVRIDTNTSDISLSVQHLIDCSRDRTNRGCSGGSVYHSLRTLKNNLWFVRNEEYYEYSQSDNYPCRSNNFNRLVRITGFNKCNNGSCSVALLKNFLSTSPYASGLTLDNDFIHYKSGVYTMQVQDCRFPNHAVLVTHIDEDQSNVEIKNSWGTSWGENGFGRVSFKDNDNNTACGLLDSGYIVTSVEYK